VQVPDQDNLLATRMKLLSFIGPEALEIKESLRNDMVLALARDELRKMNSYRTPSEKVECIVKCAAVIFSSLNLARGKLKDQLYFVFCDSWVQNLNYGNSPRMTELPVDFKSAMQRLQNEFMSSKFIILQQTLYHNSAGSEMHGGNHVKEIVHKRFAEEIYNNLISKQLV
jgi:hypothetical protein